MVVVVGSSNLGADVVSELIVKVGVHGVQVRGRAARACDDARKVAQFATAVQTPAAPRRGAAAVRRGERWGSRSVKTT